MKKVVVPDSTGDVTDVAPGATVDAIVALGRTRRLRLPKIGTAGKLFAATVLLPTVLASVYFGFVASDIYTSEARYVLRSPQRQVPTGLGAILQGAGFTRAQDDTYSVHDFILSRDALRQLNTELRLKQRFSDGTIDLFNRFAAIDPDDSDEALHLYYQKRVTVEPDPISAISTIRVTAFDPDTAKHINERLLQMSEGLVNRLNERGRQDLVRFAEREVAQAEDRTKSAALALSAFRKGKAVFDPARESVTQLQLISKLQDELIATRNQLIQVRTLSRESPVIPALELQLKSLRDSIDAENRKVTGNDRSLSDKSTDFERLTLDREFAERQLASAMSALEQSRNDAQRKQLYLERIVEPSRPDAALEPRRIRGVLATLLLGLVAWGILSMLIAGVREHQD